MNIFKPYFLFACLAVLFYSCSSSSERVSASDLDMVEVHAGNFTMGVSADNRRKVTRGIAQPVALDGFRISSAPVSQALWVKVMGKNPSQVEDLNAPVDMVSWVDVQKFLKRLGKMTGESYLLPTEAQWEYAHHLNGDKGFTSVAEWCRDNYDEVPEDKTRDDYFVPMSLMVNPKGPEKGTAKVVRTTLERMPVEPHTRKVKVGFRLVQPTDDVLTEAMLETLDGTRIVREKVDASDGKPEVFTVGGASFEMVKVQGGNFVMGFDINRDNPYLDFTVPDNEIEPHQVTLDDFAIGESEVTVGLWYAVMGAVPYLNDIKEPDKPVGNVSWYDCQVFLRKLNGLTGRTFRLPTEAEWEYAARGGQRSRRYGFSGGNDMKSVMWFLDNADSKTRVVKTRKPNELGLYDMCGNVWEWCYDRAAEYTADPAVNPSGATEGGQRILRGGSCASRWDACRISNRLYMPGKNFRSTFGLRLAL